jgi:hypothetical protein
LTWEIRGADSLKLLAYIGSSVRGVDRVSSDVKLSKIVEAAVLAEHVCVK